MAYYFHNSEGLNTNMGLASYILSYGVALLGIAIVAAYFRFTRNFGHWKRKGIKELRPLPFVGNLKDVAFMKKNIGMTASAIYEQHKKEPFIGIYAFDEPVLQVHDLDLVKAVLVKDFHYFPDRSLEADEELDPLPARGLVLQRGERWKHQRNAITPTFTSRKMKRMYELPMEVYELAARYTTDVIAICAFGIKGNNLEDPKAEFRRILRAVFEFSPRQALAMATVFLAPKLTKLLRLKVIGHEVESFVRSTVEKAIKERENKNVQRNDLLDTFDERDVCGQAFAFLTAGFETSATTISYALFEIAQHKDVQDKLRKELQNATSDGDFSYETLHGLKYLDMVMQETLRKYPPLPFLDRKCSKAYTLPGTDVTLEAGSRIMVPLHALQMDPEYHPNPKKFDPERFSEENKKNIINYTHMPFGEGPRNCVGMRFALMQVKSALAHLLMKYTIHPCDTTPQEIKFNPQSFLLQPKDKIQLEFYLTGQKIGFLRNTNMGLASYILSYGVALLGVAIVAVYFHFTRNFGHWKRKGIKELRPLPFVGNMKDVAFMKKSIGMVASAIYEQHKKEPFIGIYAFDEPVLQVHDLDLVKAVLVKDFQYFPDRSVEADEELDPVIARGLFVQTGERWKRTRNAITPSFTSGKMKRMYDIVTQCGKLRLLGLEKEKLAAFNELDVCGQSFAFLTAGYETSATTISYALFEIAQNKDVQDKLRKELQNATSDGDFSYETLHGLKYLDMVMQGMRFALMQVKSALAHLLMKYSVEPCETTPREIKFNPQTFLLQPKENFQLIFNPLP
ncbi:Cytochrome P450 4e3 [Gryllus bimaculatus]|nr:Cytochrome P450 4e3 [Gryllus bimaculatus]